MTVCKDCKERKMGCHSVCEKYITEKAVHDKQRLDIWKKKQIEDDLDRQMILSMRRKRK